MRLGEPLGQCGLQFAGYLGHFLTLARTFSLSSASGQKTTPVFDAAAQTSVHADITQAVISVYNKNGSEFSI